MSIKIHPHARERMKERGATESEVRLTIEEGERYDVKFGRVGFRRNFLYNSEWCGRFYHTKQIEAVAVEEEGWLVLTVIVKYF